MAQTQRQQLGAWGEERAALFLREQGYDIIDRNYTVMLHGKKAGEVDIIAWHAKHHFGKTLCFIEVKTRAFGGGDEEGSAERATNEKKKLSHLFFAARHYCLTKDVDIDHTPIQFEHVSVYVDGKTKAVNVRWYEIPVE